MASTLSTAMRFAILILTLQGSDLKEKRFPRWRRNIEGRTYPQPTPIPGSLRKQHHVQEQMVNGQLVYTIVPKQRKASAHIIYFHGGAYVNPLVAYHWSIIRALVETVGASVTVPTYPLAPEHTYKAAFEVLETVYRGVLQEFGNQTIVLSGDSAGGGLALAQAMRYRDLGIQPPDRVLLFAPWLDITLSNPEVAAIEPHDVLLGIPGLLQCGQWWVGGDDPRHPLVSPIFGDLAGLPPMDVFQGTADLLAADVRKLKDKVLAAGGEINLTEVPGGFHVYVGATFVPEAREAYESIARTLGVQPAVGR